ncbi:MAG: DinB family protein [Dehalococcoidia bacterium]
MREEHSVGALWTSIRGEQSRLRTMLDGAGGSDLARRPQGGGWSILEVLRHLLFAEEAHLGRHEPGHTGWSPLGYTPATMRDARKVGARDEDEPSADEVLAEWQAVHERLEEALRSRDDEPMAVALERNLRHLRAHIRSIERALRRGSER